MPHPKAGELQGRAGGSPENRADALTRYHCTILALTNWRKKYKVNSTDRLTVIQDIALPNPNLVSSIARRVI